ncbi:MAG TPA: ABC transporter substrate-binding protein [Micromonosporaceae bacterium]
MSGISTHRRPLAILGLVLSLVLIGTGCAKKESGGTSEKGTVKLVKQGQLTVCTGLPYAPFEFQRGNEVVGFDVELTELVAKDLGVKQEYVDTPFEGIKSGQDLNSGKCDVAAAAMTITEEREQALDFSEGYFDAHQAMLVRAGKGYKALADLKGKRVGVQTGTTGEIYVKEQNDKEKLDLKIVAYEDLGAEQAALEGGQIEAIINDLPVWTEYVKENPGKFEIAAEFDTGEQYGMAVKTGNKALLDVINKVLAKAKQDGTYDKVYEKWIGRKPAS